MLAYNEHNGFVTPPAHLPSAQRGKIRCAREANVVGGARYFFGTPPPVPPLKTPEPLLLELPRVVDSLETPVVEGTMPAGMNPAAWPN